MNQNIQPIENNMEIKLDNEGEPISPKTEKKINKKIISLIIIILVIIGYGTVYFLFLNKEDNSKLPIDDDVAVLEDKKEVEIDKKLDTDQDGLPDFLEKILGTDENNSDTDGDSYSDFEEIKNGYNPLNSEKYVEEEWERTKEIIRSDDEGLFNEMFENYEIIQKAISVCQKMEDENQKNLCLALTKNNSSECEGQPSILKEGCYLMYAFLDSDTSICEKSLDSGLCLATILKDDSKCEFSDDVNTCYTSVASSKEDSSICQKIENEIMQNICLATINKDIKHCKNIDDESFFEDMCFFSLSMAKNDVSICNEMKLKKQDNCIAFVNRDINKINCEDMSTINYCSLIGMETMDDSFCDLIKTGNKTENSFDEYFYKTSRDSCRLTVASQILSTLK